MNHFKNNAPRTSFPRRRCATWCLLLAIVTLATGCSKFDIRRKIPWSDEVPDDPATPTKVVAVWSEAVLHQTDKPPMRGFGGRLFFYNGKEESGIKAEGTLVVYAFDETDGDKTKVIPDRKYVFPAENLERHRAESNLGHSYEFWIPWDEAGGEQRRISLVVRFTPKAGSLIVSKQDNQMLPGRLPEQQPETSLAQRARDFGATAAAVRQVSYDAPIAPQSPLAASGTRPLESLRQQSRMVTTTIPISGTLGNRPPTSIARPAAFRKPSRTLMRRSVETGTRALGQSQQPPRGAAWGQAARQSSRPSARFSRARSRTLGAPIERLDRGRLLWQQPPAASPYDSRSSLPPESPAR